MNITHAVKEEVNGDMLEAIFNRQKELMLKYHDIELRSGLMQTPDCPVNLDDKRGQSRIKDFAWRITEELGEALDAVADYEHYTEEMIDGLHFLTELSILSGINPDDIISNVIEYLKHSENDGFIGANILYKFDGPIESDKLHFICNMAYEIYEEYDSGKRVKEFIMHLGMMCNCLKNKPWKQSNMKTDKKAFYERLGMVWLSYLSIIITDVKPDDICEIYLKKSQVNKFRQRSNY